jgi:hypothetical protein
VRPLERGLRLEERRFREHPRNRLRRSCRANDVRPRRKAQRCAAHSQSRTDYERPRHGAPLGRSERRCRIASRLPEDRREIFEEELVAPVETTRRSEVGHSIEVLERHFRRYHERR